MASSMMPFVERLRQTHRSADDFKRRTGAPELKHPPSHCGAAPGQCGARQALPRDALS